MFESNFVMLIVLVLIFSIPSINCFKVQEDFNIENYYNLGCVQLKADLNNFLLGNNQNQFSTYQTFIGNEINVKLCFRLCRRTLILFQAEEKICFCFYTINNIYEIQNFLGKILKGKKCFPNSPNIYSLNKFVNPLPLPTATQDWSIDGCYHIQAIENATERSSLIDLDWPKAMKICRERCENRTIENYFTFFVSLDQHCYCTPILLSPKTKSFALRKPLIHCSFLPEIELFFEKKINFSMIDPETIIKIDVQRHCSLGFTFNREMYICIKFVQLEKYSNYSELTTNESCKPFFVENQVQWKYLFSLILTFPPDLYFWIDRNSTYLMKNFKKDSFSQIEYSDLCLSVRWNAKRNKTISRLVSCSSASSSNNFICFQKSFEMQQSLVGDFELSHNNSNLTLFEQVYCPEGSKSFNGRCYFVDSVLSSNVSLAEARCSNLSVSGTLVRFENHRWPNVNLSQLLSRTFDDVLLEYFYWELEQKFANTSSVLMPNAHWFRLLLGKKSNMESCFLRYFDRASGKFMTIDRCRHGGYPVCQLDPIDKESINNSSIQIADDEITTDLSHMLIDDNSIVSEMNQSNNSIHENSTKSIYDDGNSNNNESSTEISSISIENNPSTKFRSSIFRSLLAMIVGPILALLLLVSCILFIGYYMSKVRGSYSPSSPSSISSQRRKRLSSTPPTSSEISHTPAVLYTRYKSGASSIGTESEPMLLADTLGTTDETVQLITRVHLSNKLHVTIEEEQEEPIYAVVRDSSIQ